MGMQFPTWQSSTGITPSTFAGGGMPDPGWMGDVGTTFTLDPEGLWQAGRLQQMTPTQLVNPQWTRQAMTGFTPTYGQYALAGAPGTFGSWLADAPPAAGYATPLGGDPWTQAVAASGALLNPTAATTLTPTQVAQQGLLVGENARRNAIAMTAAAMGGGIGMGAQARQRALGNLYDLYAARAVGRGDPQGGFLNWISGRLDLQKPTANPTAGIGAQMPME